MVWSLDRREILNFARLAAVENFKVILGQIGNRLPVESVL